MPEGVFLFCKDMIADGQNHLPGKDPFAGAFGGVVKIDGAAGGVAAVEGVLRRLAGTVCNGHGGKLPVRHRAESARLVDYAGDCVRKRGVPGAIEDDGPHGHLTGIGLAPGLCGDGAGKQIKVIVPADGNAGDALPAAVGRHPQRLQGLRAADAVLRKTVDLLKIAHGGGCFAAIDAVHLSAVIAPALQLGLDGLHLLAGAALTVNGGVGACGQQDHQHDGRENSADPDPVLPIHMHIAPFSHRICAARGIMYPQE